MATMGEDLFRTPPAELERQRSVARCVCDMTDTTERLKRIVGPKKAAKLERHLQGVLAAYKRIDQ